ncbi:MAG: GEVED domain-containing protein, partial [Chitinophagaceae bacterium]
VQYTPTVGFVAITITFETEVTNANFTLYDIDQNAIFGLSATNAASVPQNIGVLTQAGTILAVGGTITNPTITAGGGNLGNNSNKGSATISVAGPVKTIIIAIANPGTDPVFWLSDINGCVTGSFPNAYYNVSQPFSGGMAGGQPAYFLNVVDDSVYMTNPADGKSKFLFTDAASAGKINSVGYDPYNHIMYFVYSLTGAATTNKTLRKYDFTTGLYTTITTDMVTLLNIPTFDQGVESGAAAFYNGSLYFGVEASNPSRNSGREHIIWKIDFNSSGNAYRSTQVYATPSDAGGALAHDWSDFVISKGILYDFDGAAASVNIDHFDLMTGARTNYVPTFSPRQATVIWNEQVYEVGSNSALLYDGGHVQPYNYNGTVNGAQNFQVVQVPATVLKGSWGDAGEAFRPKGDFGDAPASYDPIAQAPAVHENDALLRLGATIDDEWILTSSLGATADGGDEDGIGAAPALNYDATLTYSINVSVFNNTGAAATMIGWLDYNFNNVFDAGEGVSVSVPSAVGPQMRTITWTNIYVPLTIKTRTYLRIRLTRGANAMTTANMNGWYPDGEVEDYPVLMGSALPKDVLTIGAEVTENSTVTIKWSALSESPISNFEIMRSSDNQAWEKIATVNASGTVLNNKIYNYTDIDPVKGNSYYRIKVNYATTNNAYRYTEIRSVRLDTKKSAVRVQPNPVTSIASLQLSSPKSTIAKIDIVDGAGKVVLHLDQQVTAGSNTIILYRVSTLPKGVYTVRAQVDTELLITQFVKSQQ